MGCCFSLFNQQPKNTVTMNDYLPCGCCICMTGFNNTKDLLTHIGSHELETINKFIKRQTPIVRCDVCNSKFRTVLHLKNHMHEAQHSSF